MENEITSWRLSRSVLSQKSSVWEFHASWCRFVDRPGGNLSLRVHQHAFYELHCILKGRASIIYAAGNQVTLQSGDFVLLPPRVQHRFVYEEQDTVKLVTGFSVTPHDAFISDSLRAIDGTSVYQQSLPMKNLIETLRLKASQPDAASPASALFLLQCIVLECLETIGAPEKNAAEIRMKNSLNDVRLDQAKRLIEQRITERLTGAEVAAQLGLSLRQLNRLSNDAFSCSIGHLILQMRMKHAQTLLEATALSLSDIAERLHYSSVYAFIRAFKSVMGTSPGEFQRDASLR